MLQKKRPVSCYVFVLFSSYVKLTLKSIVAHRVAELTFYKMYCYINSHMKFDMLYLYLAYKINKSRIQLN